MRKIIHLDLDCFYAAVEEKYNPSLKEKPVGIGGPSDSRGVLCTANYAARKFGVRAAMPTAMAKKLCPDLVLIPPHFDLYKKESKHVFSIYAKFAEKVEPLSLDEAYLDVSHAPNATLVAQEIRKQVLSETQLTVSAGVAPNKFLAKVASDWKKPNGCFVIKPHEIDAFVRTLPVSKLFGIGKVTSTTLQGHGIKTCFDLQTANPILLRKILGSRWKEFVDMAQGIDHREVSTDSWPKSLSIEETFEGDLTNFKSISKQITDMYPSWIERFQNCLLAHPELEIKTWFVKIKYANFKSLTRNLASTQNPCANDFEDLAKKLWEASPEPIRLIGFGLKFKPKVPNLGSNLPLFQYSPP